MGFTEHLPHQLPHPPIQSLQRQRIHAPAHQLPHHLDRIGEVPLLFGHRVEPHRRRIGARHALEPQRARLLVEMLDRAARRRHLVW